jgi:PhzF family phenazine biosynthesis protein
MQQRPFKQVDVFTATPYLGNPVAVVLDASGLSDDAMAGFARWTNLSETTFVLPPTEAGRAGGADYRLRIFTPGGELPFAGHPTLGTCHAWLEHSGSTKTTLVQECGVSLVQIARSQEHGMQRLAFAAPPCKRSNPSPAVLAQVAAALGLKEAQVQAAQLLDNGPVWLGVLVDSAQTVLALAPDHAQLKALGQKVGVVHVDRASTAIKNGANELTPSVTVRAFAAPIGINEDPVTGSLNASLAQWLMADGLAPARYLAAQGECLGRAGRVHVERDAGGQVWVGGASVTCIDGTVNL